MSYQVVNILYKEGGKMPNEKPEHPHGEPPGKPEDKPGTPGKPADRPPGRPDVPDRGRVA